MAEKVVAQRWQWQCSNGLDSAVTEMAAQRWLRRRSDGNGNGGAAMGVAVVVAAQQWRCGNGGGGAAIVVDRNHRRVLP